MLEDGDQCVCQVGRTETLNDDYRRVFGEIMGLRPDCVEAHVSELSSNSMKSTTTSSSSSTDSHSNVGVNRREGEAAGVRTEGYYLENCRESVAKLNERFRVEMDAFGYAPV
uniref:Uncharacterized protein n=1 Tax=Lotharella oceanica TaxID=641309 RepID=A0A7S2XEC7_9EUKA|mmetsp:Transcript_3405/g.6668  ORF Transcript_3405/g.6668 Transcript_3405/m.6668 type:complete len:112 (+) Transcript_3405:2-337(+)